MDNSTELGCLLSYTSTSCLMYSKSLTGLAAAIIASIRNGFSIALGKRVTDPATYTAHDPLWAGIDRKLQDAQFSLDEMAKSLQSEIWQELFYAHISTFLAKVRSSRDY